MNGYLRFRLFAVIFLLTVTTAPYIAHAGDFLAFSMREAERRLKASSSGAEVSKMGGITRLAGMVYDSVTGDFIVVGQSNAGEDPARLDDFVVAMRALLLHRVWPLVSIDKMPDTPQTGKQKIRFVGGLENSAFGRDLLDADIVLKKLALGLLASEVWGLKSYFAMSAEYARAKGVEENISTRFWFYPLDENYLAIREGVFAIMDLKIGVRTQVMQATVKGKPAADLSGVRDPLGEDFAKALTAAYEDVSAYYPEIRRLKTRFDLVALARGIQALQPGPNLDYWLREYPVEKVDTQADYPLLRQREEIRGGGGTRVMEIEGGIEIRALVLRLQDGDVTALREAVMRSRPHGDALTWKVPLNGWHLPGTPEFDPKSVSVGAPTDTMGAYLTRQIYRIDAAGAPASLPNAALSIPALPSVTPASRDFATRLPTQAFGDHVGGVLLRGTAHVPGAGEARVDLTSGQFSLIVDGKSARLAPQAFWKFITALWAVYFSDKDPGVSIDPIAPGVDKHLVRYIGKVVNTDLGRVMREADYLMKKWAVGTDQPNIAGFRDVDDLSARHGLRFVGASRRFWFLPEAMRFRRGGDLLLFDAGRMTLQTEYVLQNKGVRAERADERFAAFFTEKYHEAIAKRYPVYQELFEYAKMVSLAKYLKDSGVPLFWFLMANKDLVITEDSPGTVDALARGSRHFDGLTIEGGVDLRTQGQYVFDRDAARALEERGSRAGNNIVKGSEHQEPAHLLDTGTPAMSFDFDEKTYTVVPQHSLISGKDARGVRYQTDLALRGEGRPGLELVRYYNPADPSGGEFGQGWHLLVPYRIRPVGGAKREFLNVRVPEKMVLQNLVSGDEEVLAFSADRYSIAGYVPDKLVSSQVIGLFLMSDASYRLADKLGNEFSFDPTGYLKDMVFSEHQGVHLDYQDRSTDAFEQAPYRVQPAGDERIPFRNARIPKRMKIIDQSTGASEELAFNDQGQIAGYVPEDQDKSRFQLLALMSDASFRLLDKAENEIAFTAACNFAGMAISPRQRMVKSISQENQRVDFTYALDRVGRVRIVSARLKEDAGAGTRTHLVRYEYDDEDRLARVVKETPERVTEFDRQPEHPRAFVIR